MEKLLDHLENIHPLSDELKLYLCDHLRSKSLSRKEHLLKAGHISRHICFIESGLLRCFYEKNGQQVNSWFMQAGDVIISVESFFTQRPSYESIQALQDSLLYYINYEELQIAYKKFPEFNFIGRVLTEKYYILSEQRLYSLRMQRAGERYAYLLEHFPELVLQVPCKYLASYLGVTEVTLSNIKNKRLAY